MITLRAHHLNCIPRFYRGGYDKKFAENMKNLCLAIRENPNTKIKIVIATPDDLCKKCPHLYKEKCVQSKKIGKWVEEQDKKIAEYLQIKNNSIHNAKEIFNLAIEKTNKDTIRQVCKDCIFLKNCIKVGINKSFQKEINRK